MSPTPNRTWTVASAVIEVDALIGGSEAPFATDGPSPGTGSPSVDPPDAVLLVENLRRNGTSDWTPPGGVVDAGERPLDGLAREVAEETGLRVVEWAGLLYEIVAEAPDLGWTMRVEVHRASAVDGRVEIGADPDGIVIGSAWAATPRCVDLLVGAHQWVREPLLDWMRERWSDPRSYGYRILGSTSETFSVERL